MLVNKKLNTTWQRAFAAQKAERVLGCMHSGQQVEEGDSAPLLYSGGRHLDYCIQLWSPQHRTDMDLLERVQKRSTKMIRGLEHLSCEEKLRELELFSLQKRGLSGDLIAAFQYLEGAYKKSGEGFFTRACSDRTTG